MLDRYVKAIGGGLLVLGLALAPAAAQEDDPFTVSNVHVDVTASDALKARDQALAEGQQRAFAQLVAHISNAKVPKLSADALTDLVAGFEVANERRSGVRYVADYTFHFRAAEVRKLLGDNAPPPTDTAAAPTPAPAPSAREPAVPAAAPGPAPPPTPPLPRPAIVLAVLKGGDRPVLWDDPNPWRDAWANHVTQEGPVSAMLPIGDLPDVQAIDAAAALRGDPAALRTLSSRYQNADVLVAEATLSGVPRRVDIAVYRYPGGNAAAPRTTTLSDTIQSGESDAILMDRAVVDTLHLLQQSPAPLPPPVAATAAAAPLPATAIDAARAGAVVARFKGRSLADWVAIRERLKTVIGMRSSDLIAMDRDQLQIALRFNGDATQLKAALRQKNLDLTGGDPDWTLEQRGDAGPKAAAAAASTSPKPADPPLDSLRKADPKP